MIRELLKKLSAFDEFVNFVIIELQFRRGTFVEDAEILKHYSSMAILQVSSPESKLIVKMIRPRKEITAAFGSRIQSSEKIWRVFTVSEVLEFAEAVDDKNPIHQLKPPIVPALLILETICAELPDCQVIKLKFKNFITVGEPLSLQVNNNRLKLTSAGVRKILGEFS